MKKLAVLFLFIVISSAHAQQPPAKSKVIVKKPAQYNLPIYFNPEDVGVKKVSYELSWDLKEKNNLKIGSLVLDAGSFVPAFYQGRSKSHPFAGQGEADKDMLFLIWPRDVLKSGTLEIIARDGSVLWSDSFDIKDFKKWQNRIQKLKQQVSEDKQKENKVLFSSGIALTGLSAETLAKFNGSFRFCLTQQTGKEHSMLCTPKHTVAKKDGEISLARIIEEGEARILVDREEAPLSGKKNVESGQIISLFSETSTGLSYEFTTRVLPIQTFDIFKDADGVVLLSGIEPVPFGAGVYESKNDDDNFWNRWGWEQTLGDLRTYWQIPVPENKQLTFPGSAGGAFQLTMDFTDIPSVADRVWVSNFDVKETYKPRKALHLFHSENQKLQGVTAGEIVENVGRSGEAIWNFSSPEVGAYNISKIDVLEGSKTLKASYEVYRGNSSELSGRFTAAVDKNLQSIIFGELSYNKWFENLWGWDNKTLSTLRWGLSAKYLKTLTSVTTQDTVSSDVSKADLSAMSLNLKYRFNPGLWGRDETWGLLGGYEALTIGDISAPVLGVGFFWARSMPRVFDDMFSFLPFMKYSKFVDMEFTYFPTSLDSNVSIASSYLISFHGKVLWSKTFFGEAGFGMQSYSLQDKTQITNISMSAFYLTIGMGVNF
ncbi:MAG: hypothetical protein ACXVCY_11300 [Pseudobdellovibrionaceae bacterium]